MAQSMAQSDSVSRHRQMPVHEFEPFMSSPRTEPLPVATMSDDREPMPSPVDPWACPAAGHQSPPGPPPLAPHQPSDVPMQAFNEMLVPAVAASADEVVACSAVVQEQLADDHDHAEPVREAAASLAFQAPWVGVTEPVVVAAMPQHDESLPAVAGAERQRRRPRRRDLRCPLHPEQKLFSVSPKHHLYLTDVGQLMLRGLSKRRADELLAAYRRVLPLTDEWIEAFWCDDCAGTRWWHVKRHDRHEYTLTTVPRELWEQATGVIRAEGNPTVSDFTRRQARARGVHGLRQYRFL